jgi:hypothetical protein
MAVTHAVLVGLEVGELLVDVGSLGVAEVEGRESCDEVGDVPVVELGETPVDPGLSFADQATATSTCRAWRSWRAWNRSTIWRAWGKWRLARFQIQGAPSPSTTRVAARSAPRWRASAAMRRPKVSAGSRVAR